MNERRKHGTHFKCPHCGRQTSVFGADQIKTIEAGRAICEHCQKEFFIVNNVPMAEQ